jgi:O-methyltransferase
VLTRVRARENFIRSLAVEQISMPGSIAEAGVYRGEFSKHISRAYPDRKFYLFDTFSGFPQNDMRTERLFNNTPFMEQRNFCETDVELVRSKLVNPEKAVFCVGEFPESAQNIKDRYCFVSIDMDLYEPTYQALIFFYPCMVDGGVILLHDYYGEAFPNVRRAVNDFEVKLGVRLAKLPIGDDCSLAILKTVV